MYKKKRTRTNSENGQLEFHGFRKIPYVRLTRLKIPLKESTVKNSNKKTLIDLKKDYLTRLNFIQNKSKGNANHKFESSKNHEDKDCVNSSKKPSVNGVDHLNTSKEESKKCVSFSDFVIIHEYENPDQEDHYNCTFCFKSYPDIRTLKEHVLLHCTYCQKLFKTKMSLDRHIEQKTHHQSSKIYGVNCFICDYCKMSFNRYCSIAHHIAMQHDKLELGYYRKKSGVYLCNFCSKVEFKKKSMQKHAAKLSKGGIKIYKCNQCNLTFKSNLELKIHCVKYVGIIKMGEDYIFSMPWDLKPHVKIERSNNPIFRNAEIKMISTDLHQDSLPANEITRIDYVDNNLTKSDNIKVYSKKPIEKKINDNLVIPVVDLSLEIDLDPEDTNLESANSNPLLTSFLMDTSIAQEFLDISSLNKTKRVHPEIKSCSVCNKVFKRNSDINRHILTVHTDYNNLTCLACGTIFTDERDMMCHRCYTKSISKFPMKLKKLFKNNIESNENSWSQMDRSLSNQLMHSWREKYPETESHCRNMPLLQYLLQDSTIHNALSGPEGSYSSACSLLDPDCELIGSYQSDAVSVNRGGVSGSECSVVDISNYESNMTSNESEMLMRFKPAINAGFKVTVEEVPIEF